MFSFADRRLGRRLTISLLTGLVAACLLAGGGLAYALNCNVLDYMDRASISPHNSFNRYLFACGYVWHSFDGGLRWERVDPHGLPIGVRDGFIAVDNQPGRLYLGLLTTTASSIHCWDCAWKNLRPVIYVSTDGGSSWVFSYKFKRGPAGGGGFIGLYADPAKANFVYAIIKNRDEITFYASGTAGQFWKPMCVEYYDAGRTCSLPEAVMKLNFPASFLYGE